MLTVTVICITYVSCSVFFLLYSIILTVFTVAILLSCQYWYFWRGIILILFIQFSHILQCKLGNHFSYLNKRILACTLLHTSFHWNLLNLTSLLVSTLSKIVTVLWKWQNNIDLQHGRTSLTCPPIHLACWPHSLSTMLWFHICISRF
jgi:hypothetical protein